MIAIVSSIAALLHQCIAGAMRAVHVSAPHAPLSNRPGCNRGATPGPRRPSRTSWMCSALLGLAFSLGGAPAVRAQDEPRPVDPASRQEHRGALIVTFLAG